MPPALHASGFFFCPDGERQCPPRSGLVREDGCGTETSQCRSGFSAAHAMFESLAAICKNPHTALDCYPHQTLPVVIPPGVDVNIVDQKGLTALDTVKDMPSQKSREIAALILGEDQDVKTENCDGKYPHFTSCDTISCLSVAGHMAGKPPDIDLPPPPVPPPQESPSPRKKGKIYQMLEKLGV